MKRLFILLLFIITIHHLQAQANFIKKGKIEFERKTNVHRLYYTDEEESSWTEQMKKMIPQFKVDYFDMFFTEEKSIYQPGRETDDNKKTFFFLAPGSANIVYKDLSHETSISQKQIFEDKFLITDSLRPINWKIQPETRTIAGFECRKAVGRICDSVVVVAFYTDEIIPASGPESFSGLPGMILGLAIPRLYTTWFATKVELLDDAGEKKIIAPTKGKKASEKGLLSKIDDGIKDWGEKYRNRSIWFASL